MKKIIIILFLLLAPHFASATITQNLYYGLTQNSQVRELQQFLITKGFLTGSPTGNFFSMTFTAVKRYQASKNINSIGYVGPATRQAINAELSSGQVSNPGTSPVALKGLLDLIQNTTYSSQTVTAPQTNFKLADFNLTNNTNEPIDLKKIQIDLAVGADLYVTNLYVKNLYIIYDSVKTGSLDTVSHNNYFNVNYNLPVGKKINISLYGDVNSSIPINSAIKSSILLNGTTSVSKTLISTNLGDVFAGQSITFGSGSFTVAKDSSSPSARMLTYGQRVVAGKFQFTSAGNSYTISEIKFVVPNSSNFSIISGGVLYDTTSQTQLTSMAVKPTYSGKDSIFDFNVNIPVLLNSSKYITLYYDLGSNTGLSSANANIAPVLTYIKAVDSRGTTFDNLIPVDKGIITDDLYAFKSVPSFTNTTSNIITQNNSDANVYTFSVGADPKGEVLIKQLKLSITVSDLNKQHTNLSNFSFLKNGVEYTSPVINSIVRSSDGRVTNLINNYIGSGTYEVFIIFVTPEVIPAGKTQTYTLRAHLNNFYKSSDFGADSISAGLPKDSTQINRGFMARNNFGFYSLSPYQNRVSNDIFNVLWTDISANTYDASGLLRNDWYNSYGLANFSLSSQTITAK